MFRQLLLCFSAVALTFLATAVVAAADAPVKPPQPRQGVTIQSGPADWQVIQRDKSGVADITIAGTWSTTEKKNYYIQARIVDENTGEPVTAALDWNNAVMDAATKHYTMTLKSVPQGGLYRLETRLSRPMASEKRPDRGDYVHHLGVGDIYIIAGQSNASGTGKGAADDGPMLGVALFGNDEQWKLATHPLEDATHSLHPITMTTVFHGHEPWMSFAKRVYTRTGIPIALVPCAEGGTPISAWVTDAGGPTPLFANMMDMFNKVGGKVAGILWHQGESDAFAKLAVVAKYPERFRLLVALIRKQMSDPNLPIFTGQLNTYVSQPDPVMDESFSRIREMQRSLAHEIPGVYMAVTLDLALDDEIHNSAASNVIVGERYANLALEHIYGKPILAEFPEPATVTFLDDTRKTISVTFTNLAGDLTAMPHMDDFTVQDSKGAFVPIKSIAMVNNREVRVRLNAAPSGPVTLTALYGMRPLITLHDDLARCLTAFTVPVAEVPPPVLAPTDTATTPAPAATEAKP